MKRVSELPRADWRQKVEALGLTFHTIDEETYWDESAYYEFSGREVEVLEEATRELQDLCVKGAEVAIREDWRERLRIPELAWREVVASWERDDLSLYGRFDLMWDGRGRPKLLEYNADTPTGLLEAAVVQWHWLEEQHPGRDQFNMIHELLLAGWKEWPQGQVHFTAQGEAEEDWRTLLYLEDTCRQSGKQTINLAVESMGWDSGRGSFVGEQGEVMELVFKLYPWEWMWAESFGPQLPGQTARFLEPVWKMIWSNKAFLVLLWETFEGHPLLLPAAFSPDRLGSNYVEKPIFGREGANVRMVQRGRVVAQQEGPWDWQPMVYQELHPEVVYEGAHPVLGSWVIGGEAAGIGVREDRGRITSNGSRFVPHLF
jgi:glutathionylspermidine synthase